MVNPFISTLHLAFLTTEAGPRALTVPAHPVFPDREGLAQAQTLLRASGFSPRAIVSLTRHTGTRPQLAP